MHPYIYEIYFHIVLKTIWRPLQLLNADKGGCFFVLFCFIFWVFWRGVFFVVVVLCVGVGSLGFVVFPHIEVYLPFM